MRMFPGIKQKLYECRRGKNGEVPVTFRGRAHADAPEDLAKRAERGRGLESQIESRTVETLQHSFSARNRTEARVKAV